LGTSGPKTAILVKGPEQSPFKESSADTSLFAPPISKQTLIQAGDWSLGFLMICIHDVCITGASTVTVFALEPVSGPALLAVAV
jgi:hypothetical protein